MDYVGKQFQFNANFIFSVIVKAFKLKLLFKFFLYRSKKLYDMSLEAESAISWLVELIVILQLHNELATIRELFRRKAQEHCLTFLSHGQMIVNK